MYFGESSPPYSIVGGPEGTKNVELDYPAGSDDSDGGNATTTYQGNGGPSLGGFFNRLVYAAKFQSEQILLSTPSTATRRSSTTATRSSVCRRSRPT